MYSVSIITLLCSTGCSVGRSAITMKKYVFRVKVGRHPITSAIPFLNSVGVQLESYFYVDGSHHSGYHLPIIFLI